MRKLDALEVRDGVPYHTWEDEQGDVARFLLVVPKSLAPKVLSAVHDSLYPG